MHVGLGVPTFSIIPVDLNAISTRMIGLPYGEKKTVTIC